MEYNKELIETARKAGSPEELLAFAKENGVEMTGEDAKNYFDQLHPKTGELSDNELDNVAGGGCYARDGALMTTIGYKCKNFERSPERKGVKGTCYECKYWDYGNAEGNEIFGNPLKCLNPNNYRKKA